MYPILLKFGPVTIYSFGVAVVISALVALFLIWKQARKRGLPEEKIFDVFLLTVFVGLIGARLGYVFSNWNQFSTDISKIILITHYPGLSFTWALLCGVGSIVLFSSVIGLETFLILDIFALAFSWSFFVGLWGCFLDGCLVKNTISLEILLGISFLLSCILLFARRKISSSIKIPVLARCYGLLASSYLIFVAISLLIIPGVARGNDKKFYLALLFISIITFMVKFPSSVLSQIKGYLEEKRKEGEERLSKLKKEDPFEDNGRLLDRASEDSEVQSKAGHERVTAMQQQLNTGLVQIRKALTKIKIGKYGICESCGKMIDTDRLAAMPTAVLCLNCEKKREK